MFLNYELENINKKNLKQFKIIDINFSKKTFPDMPASLSALSKKYK